MTEDRNYSDEIAYRIDQETKRVVTECFDRAKDTLRRRRRHMDFLAAILIDKEHLDRKEFEELMRNPVPDGWIPPTRPPVPQPALGTV